MAEMQINMWEGISDEANLQTWSEVYDARNIDLTSLRRIKSSLAYNGIDGTLVRNGWTASTLKRATENTYSIALSFTDDAKVYDKWTTTLNSVGYRSDNHISVWSDSGAYDSTTNPRGIRHFFFGYWTGKIVYTNYTGSTVSYVDVSATAEFWTAFWMVWACKYVWEWSLLVAYGNNIFTINPTVNTPTVNTTPILKLPRGAFVWNINYLNWLVHIIYTLDGDDNTYTYALSYDGTTYKGVNYALTIKGNKCIGSCNENNLMYWISSDSIHVFDGQQDTVLKVLKEDINGDSPYFYNPSGWTGSTCAFNDWFLYVNSVEKYYTYGTKKARAKSQLIEHKLDTGHQVQAWNEVSPIIHYYNWYDHKFYKNIFQDYNDRSYIVTMPYTAGTIYGLKKGLWMKIGYRLYSGTSIEIRITTDAIIRDAVWGEELYADYVLIDTITDETKQRHDILPTQIAKALATAWFSEEFSLLKIKIDLVNWQQRTWISETRYAVSPELWDVYFYHEEIR